MDKVERLLAEQCKTIQKGWDCPHCGEKPKGVQTYSGDKWLKADSYYIAPHQCAGGYMPGGYGDDFWDALTHIWGYWVKEQRTIIANPPIVVKPEIKKSFWQKLLTGWK